MIEVWFRSKTGSKSNLGQVSKELDPTAHKLKAIIGRYVFPERIRCGLSNCHTPHAKGYIVVTEDGREANIGKDCSKTFVRFNPRLFRKPRNVWQIEQAVVSMLAGDLFDSPEVVRRLRAFKFAAPAWISRSSCTRPKRHPCAQDRSGPPGIAELCKIRRPPLQSRKVRNAATT